MGGQAATRAGVRIGRVNRPMPVPAFIVEAKDETVVRTIITLDENAKRTEKQVKEPFGYLVTIPAKGMNGRPHSVRVRNDAELKRLGLDQAVPLLNPDSDDDEVVGYVDNPIKV